MSNPDSKNDFKSIKFCFISTFTWCLHGLQAISINLIGL